MHWIKGTVYRVTHKECDYKDNLKLYDDFKVNLSVLSLILTFKGLFIDLEKKETNLQLQWTMNMSSLKSHPLWVNLYSENQKTLEILLRLLSQAYLLTIVFSFSSFSSIFFQETADTCNFHQKFVLKQWKWCFMI